MVKQPVGTDIYKDLKKKDPKSKVGQKGGRNIFAYSVKAVY